MSKMGKLYSFIKTYPFYKEKYANEYKEYQELLMLYLKKYGYGLKYVEILSNPNPPLPDIWSIPTIVPNPHKMLEKLNLFFIAQSVT